MDIEYRYAKIEDAEILTEIYDAAFYDDWSRFTLITPADKNENIRFYTEKCGFDIESTEMDGKVEMVRFVLER